MSLAEMRWERERQRAHAAGLLTTDQAARRMQVPVHMVKTWARLGLITNRGAGGKGNVALWDYSELRTAPDRRVNLRERGICTEADCQAPHWSKGLCQSHYNRMRQRAGLKPSTSKTPAQNAQATLRRGRALKPPRTLPYRALAASCLDCGLLRTTPDELIRREVGLLPACPSCHMRRVKRYQREREAVDVAFRQKQRRRVDRNRKRANDVLTDTARNHRKQWTGPELEILGRDDLTARQVAEMLGRTLYAVKHQRRLLHIDPRKDRLANLPLSRDTP